MKTATLPQSQRQAPRQNYQPDLARKSTQAARPTAEATHSKPRSGGPSLNKVMIIGTLTRDPEVKATPKGTSVCEVGLALNRFYTTDQGERREETTFVDVELWGRQAELAGEFLRKGRHVYVEGRLKLDTWEDKESGQKRSKLRVVGENLQFLGNRESAGENGGTMPPPRRTPARNGGEWNEFEDEAPR